MKTNNILAIMVAFVIVPTSVFAVEPDLSIFSRNRSFNDYQRDNEINNMQRQQMLMQNQLMLQQSEAMRQENQVAAAQGEKMQAYNEAFTNITNECALKLQSGVYKLREKMIKKCTSTQAIKLAQQMNMPNIEAIKAALSYSAQVARRVDKHELTESEGIYLINQYLATH